MAITENTSWLDAQIGLWRNYLKRHPAIQGADVAELEDHLREQVDSLVDAGLAADEAFLIAVKRVGNLDELSREFAREHSDRLWKQLVVASPDSGGIARIRREAIVGFCLAVAAAVLIKLPVLFGQTLDHNIGFYMRNLTFFVLPLLVGYFAWKRRLGVGLLGWLTVAFAAAAVFANVYPFASGGSAKPLADTAVLTALHLPIALWLLVGVAYAGDRWRQTGGRMDFIRFSGEWFIYYVLIALGGVVLVGFTALIFRSISIDTRSFFRFWMLPCGAAGAVLVGAWLVEAKQSVIENMAPVLTRLFTPLFAASLITFLGAMLWTGRGVNVNRDLLIAFDLLLVAVLGLLLYSASARETQRPPGAFDVLQVVLVVSALLADVLALWAIAARITDFGVTPNRVAALGENIILLTNLTWSAVLYIRFLRKRGSFTALVRWQTDYLPVYAVWAAIVVIIFPPVFGYI